MGCKAMTTPGVRLWVETERQFGCGLWVGKKKNNVVSHLMHRTKLCTGRWQAEEKEGKWGRVKHGEAAQCGQPIEDRGCSVMRGGTGAVRRRGG